VRILKGGRGKRARRRDTFGHRRILKGESWGKGLPGEHALPCLGGSGISKRRAGVTSLIDISDLKKGGERNAALGSTSRTFGQKGGEKGVLERTPNNSSLAKKKGRRETRFLRLNRISRRLSVKEGKQVEKKETCPERPGPRVPRQEGKGKGTVVLAAAFAAFERKKKKAEKQPEGR